MQVPLSRYELPALDTTTMHDRVYGELRAALMAGRFRPGDVLRLKELAAHLGTSITPVREALKRLCTANALTYESGRSIRVPVSSQREIEQLFEVRVVLEGRAVWHAARQMSAATLERLSALQLRMNEAALNSSLSTILVLNRDFHMTLYAASESAPLVRTIDSLWLQAGPLLNAFQLESRRAEAARNQHQAILDALAAKNPNAARQALEEDLSLGLECILATLAPASGSGDGRCDP